MQRALAWPGLARLNLSGRIRNCGSLSGNAIEDLRLRRDGMTPDAYQAELLNNMLELATLEEDIERREAELANER